MDHKMKKLIALFLTILLLLMITGCNKAYIDTTYDFDYIHTNNTCYKIKSWKDYDDGEQLQVKLEDNSVMLVSSMNCELIKGECPYCSYYDTIVTAENGTSTIVIYNEAPTSPTTTTIGLSNCDNFNLTLNGEKVNFYSITLDSYFTDKITISENCKEFIITYDIYQKVNRYDSNISLELSSTAKLTFSKPEYTYSIYKKETICR